MTKMVVVIIIVNNDAGPSHFLWSGLKDETRTLACVVSRCLPDGTSSELTLQCDTTPRQSRFVCRQATSHSHHNVLIGDSCDSASNKRCKGHHISYGLLKKKSLAPLASVVVDACQMAHRHS